MTADYFFFYTESNIVCILIFIILLTRDLVNVNRQEKQVYFDHALIAHILYFTTDIFWAGVISNNIPRTRFSVVFLNFSNFVLLSAIAYKWFQFAAAAEQMPLRNTKRGILLFRLPFAVMAAAMVVAYLAAPGFWVNASCELNALYYPMMLAAPLTYVLTSCVYSLLQARKAEDQASRRTLLLIGLYPLAVVFFGVLQLAALNAPLFCFGCTIMMLFFFITSMEDQISLDPLTLLNNRGQLLRYVAQERTRRREDVRTYVVMADANDFKQINDTYGHAEGDRALTLIAEVLKSSSRTMRQPPFICRYGGDEFLLLARAREPEEVASLVECIHSGLRDICDANQTPYRLSASVGFDEWDPEKESFQACMQRADEKLYQEKKLRKQQRASASA